MVSQAPGCCVINLVYQLLGLNWLTTQCTSSGWREGKNEFSRVTHSVLCDTCHAEIMHEVFVLCVTAMWEEVAQSTFALSGPDFEYF